MCLRQRQIFHGDRIFQHFYHVTSFKSINIVLKTGKYHSWPNTLPFQIGYWGANTRTPGSDPSTHTSPTSIVHNYHFLSEFFSSTVTWLYLRHLWQSSHSIYETHSNVDLALLQRWSHVHWFYKQLANRSCRETDRARSRHYSSQWRRLHLTGQLACPGMHDTSKRIPIFMTALVDWTTSKNKI